MERKPPEVSKPSTNNLEGRLAADARALVDLIRSHEDQTRLLELMQARLEVERRTEMLAEREKTLRVTYIATLIFSLALLVGISYLALHNIGTVPVWVSGAAFAMLPSIFAAATEFVKSFAKVSRSRSKTSRGNVK